MDTNAHSTSISTGSSGTRHYETVPGLCTWDCNVGYSWSGAVSSCQPNGCVAATTGYNSHIYEIPAMNHGDTLRITSLDHPLMNGTGTSDLDFTCLIGELSRVGTESSTTITKCGADHYLTGNSCISVGNGYYSPLDDINIYSCTNKSGEYSYYTSPGGGTDNCSWQCNENFTLSGGNCIEGTQGVSCTGLPQHASYFGGNTGYVINQTWSGTSLSWVPTSTGFFDTLASFDSCGFYCETNYSRSGSIESCIPNTQIYTCPSKPDNTDWNTIDSYVQTWNGSIWIPTSTSSTYNLSSSTSSCRYKCSSGYHTEDGGVSCVSDTKTVSCDGINPLGSGYVLGTSTMSVNWTGGAWQSANSWNYVASAPGSCQYTCDTGYVWFGDYNCLSQAQIDTVLLMHGDNVSSPTNFIDSAKSKTIIRNGDVTQLGGKFGDGAMYFDGNGDYLSLGQYNDFGLYGGDFTIDAWIKTSSTTASTIFDINKSGDMYYSIRLYMASNGTLQPILRDNGDVPETFDGTYSTKSINDNQWHHIALVSKYGGNSSLYIDGELSKTANTASHLRSLDTLLLGAELYNNIVYPQFNGYIDEFRIVKGVAVWTGDFTPPTSAY